MLRTFILMAVLLWTVRCLAQQTEIDSLRQALDRHPLEDTLRLHLLTEMTYAYADIDPEQGIATARQAILLAQQLNQSVQLARAYNYQGINYSRKGEDSLALQCHQTALKLYERLRDDKGMGNTLQNMGILHFGLSDHQQALKYHQSALAAFQKVHYNKGAAAAINSIGVNYMALSDYLRAMEYYLKALRLHEKDDNALGMANALTNLGIVYKNLSRYPKALDYHAQALTLFEKVANQQGIVNALGNMGIVYDLQHQPAKAQECYQKALIISEKTGNQRGIASNVTNLGILYADMADYPKAWEHFQRSLKLYDQLGAKENKGIVLNQLGILLRQAPEAFLSNQGIGTRERYIRASDYHFQSLKLAQESGSLQAQATAWQNLHETFEAQQNHARALDAYKQYIALRDSMFNEAKTQEIARKEMQFEFDKKAALAGEEIKRQSIIKNAWMAGTGILLFTALISFAFYKYRKDAEEKRKEAEFQLKVSETEMKALRSQMNPHFIFNTLNSISDYMHRNDTESADYYLTKFARVIRLILEHSEQKLIRLTDELTVLELYMQLESLRLRHSFTYEITVDETIDREATLVPPLILQPFVENSIWHGLAGKPSNGKLLIQIKRQGEMLHCVVEDNGVGRQKSYAVVAESSPVEKKSMGMKITKARIDIINKTKATDAGVELSDLTEGMRAEIKLPLEQLF